MPLSDGLIQHHDARTHSPRSGLVQQIAAANAGERFQFRYAVHVYLPGVAELCSLEIFKS